MSLTEGWEDFEVSLNPLIINAVHKGLNFQTMMPVQKATIPLFLRNYDVAVQVTLVYDININY